MTNALSVELEHPELPADTWERAYADVLFSHIDRLKDICLEDPVERIVASLVAAFDRITLVDPVMNRSEVWRALHAQEPWPIAGQDVWYEAQETDRPRKLQAAKVMLTFRGQDQRCWCLLEVGTEYVTKPVLALRDAIEGPSYWELELRKPDVARRFLESAGIIDSSGDLAPRFRSESTE